MRAFSKSQGKVIDVSDSLTGLQSPVPEQPTQLNQPAQLTQTASNQPQTITGHTLLEHQVALQNARKAGDTAAIKQITADYDNEYQYQKDAKTATAETTQVEGLKNLEKDLTLFEENLQKSEFRGKVAGKIGLPFGIELGIPATTGLTPQSAAFDAQRTSLAYSLAKGLAQQTGQGLSDKDIKNFLTLLPSRGDTETEANLKMSNIRQMVSFRTGTPYSTEKGTTEGWTYKLGKKLVESKLNPNIVENALNEVVGFTVAMPGVFKTIMSMTPPVELYRIATKGNKATIEEDQAIIKGLFKGIIDDLGKSTGISIDENKQVHFDPMAGAIYDWNHPLSTVAWIYTFLGAAKTTGLIKSGKALEESKLAGEAKFAEEGRFPKIPPGTPAEIGPIQGRMLTWMGAPVKDSITKSELLFKDAYQITTESTARGVSKGLDAFVSKTGANIESYASKLGKVVGPQSVDDVMKKVVVDLDKTSIAQSGVEGQSLADSVSSIVRNELTKGQLRTGIGEGGLLATDISRINNARIYLNKGIPSSWFERGQPWNSAADQTNFLKWVASNALKDSMVKVDPTGYFAKAINLEHSALSVSPVLATQELSIPRSYSPFTSAWQTVQKLTEPIKIRAGRIAAGRPSPLTQSIIEGKFPEVPPASPMLIPPMNAPVAPAVESGTAVSPVFNVGNPKATQFLRDMRYQQGNWQPRSQP